MEKEIKGMKDDDRKLAEEFAARLRDRLGDDLVRITLLLERGLSYSSHGQALGAFNRELVKTGGFPKDTYRLLRP